jgi:hypothetical protein
MTHTAQQAALFAPEEIAALFDCAAGALNPTLDSLRYLGLLSPCPELAKPHGAGLQSCNALISAPTGS